MLQNRFKSNFKQLFNFDDWDELLPGKRGGAHCIMPRVQPDVLRIRFTEYPHNKKKLKNGTLLEPITTIQAQLLIGKDILDKIGLSVGSRVRLLHHPEDALQMLLTGSDNGDFFIRAGKSIKNYYFLKFNWRQTKYLIKRRDVSKLEYEVDRNHLIFQIVDI